MSKPVLGIILGIIFGALDGLSAIFYPATRQADILMGIVIGSSIKGFIVGIIVGFVARKVQSQRAMIIIGFLVGLFFAFLTSLAQTMSDQPAYWLEIMVPGSIVGMILGYATQKYGATPAEKQ